MFSENTVTKRCNITARDIKMGKRGKCAECPGALAINRLLAAGWVTLIYGDCITFVKATKLGHHMRLHVRGSAILTNFVVRYDNFNSLPFPVSFDIDIPVEAARKGVFK